MRAALLVGALLLLSACESGLARTARVEVPAAVSGAFSPADPGVLVSDLSGQRRPWVVLCGQALKQPLTLSQDLGFGCLGARAGTTETVRAWIEPLAPDAGLACTTERSFYRALSFAPADGGSDGLADAPQASWAQGSASGTWRRDLSPCGGVLSVELTLAVP